MTLLQNGTRHVVIRKRVEPEWKLDEAQAIFKNLYGERFVLEVVNGCGGPSTGQMELLWL